MRIEGAIELRRRELTAAAVPELRALFGLERLALAPAHAEFTLGDAPLGYVNGLRRAVIDEVPRFALRVPEGVPGVGFDAAASTAAAMVPQFVAARISALPINAQMTPARAPELAALRMRLDARNDGPAPRNVFAGELVVEAGVLPPALLNPTTELATLGPGERIVVRGIRIEAGRGGAHASWQAAHRAIAVPLDLAELPRAATHAPDGAAIDLSGFVESTFVSAPRRHRLAAVVAAAPDAGAAADVWVEAAAEVAARCRAAGAAASGEALLVTQRAGEDPPLESATLRLAGEGDTLGGVLAAAVREEGARGAPGSLAPAELAFLDWTARPHDQALIFRLFGPPGRTAAALVAAAAAAAAEFDSLSRALAAAPREHSPGPLPRGLEDFRRRERAARGDPEP